MLQKFINPPNEYGEVSFYWWVGEKLTKERLLWQLDRLKEKNICALQINYCHSDTGGKNYGLPMESDPPLFSEDWWDLVNWFMEECQKYNIAVSLSDYTLGVPGQEKYIDEVIKKHPEYIGKILVYENDVVVVKEVPLSVDPMNKNLGNAVIEEFYGKFEERFPNECGKGLNFFFSDELVFNVKGELWNDEFEAEFEVRKGYSITPYLKGLFCDIGDITQKIRLDYYDVMVELTEEGYFKPIYNWHQERGMILGCDHGGRGKKINEFGDYIRTQRWTQGPGNDQPYLCADIIKNKVASSIAHLYNRPRTWLEGFFGSGWGTSSSQVVDATFRNFAMGHNLLTLHGLYYTTYGSMWEWAPPCNHFRMPYWTHMDKFLECSKRLSYLLSSGVHVCDVGIIYPVAAVEGGIDGDNSVKNAFETAEYLYRNTVDFDFIDFQSIDRAEINDKKLCISGEKYSVIIVPAMKTIRYSNIEKLEEFSLKGGIVIILGDAPMASDRAGRNDAILNEKVQNIISQNGNLQTKEEVLEKIRKEVLPDIKGSENPFVLHRKIDNLDVYMVYKAKKGSEYFFRSKGEVCLFNPWTGEEKALGIIKQDDKGTFLKMPLTETEVQVIVFDNNGVPTVKQEEEEQLSIIDIGNQWEFEIIPTLDNVYGDFRLPAFDGMIGAEGRIFNFSQGDVSKTVTYSFGTYFYKLGALPKAIDDELLSLNEISLKTSIDINGKEYTFEPYDFSMRYGIEKDAGPQGSYHGLKGKITDEFIALGNKEVTQTNSNSIYKSEEAGNFYYLYTTVYAEDEMKAYIKNGTLKPSKVWMNEQEINSDEVVLKKGTNRILLRYDNAGRTYFIIDTNKETKPQTYPLSMAWYNNESILEFDPCPTKKDSPCYFTITSPPALKSIKLTTFGEVEVFVGGEIAETEVIGKNIDGASIYRATVTNFTKSEQEVKIKINSKKGLSETAISEPIEFECGAGEITLCDWAEIEGLKTYSGCARYKNIINLEKTQNVTLDLGEVYCSAEVFVNKKSAGVKLVAPYNYDISDLIVDGENIIEVEVYNTLYNHYITIPTYYNEKHQKSGLVGPVKLIMPKH